MSPGTRWALRGYQIRDEDGLGRHIATYQVSEADGRLLAAAPELLETLIAACDALDNVARCSGTDSFADEIRARLVSLRLR